MLRIFKTEFVGNFTNRFIVVINFLFGYINYTAYLQSLITADTLNAIAIGKVTFEPGARTKLHSHPAGQILLVPDGVGYYQEKNQLKKIQRKGDVIKCAPNIAHWHGASRDSSFAQLAVTGREKGETKWLDVVTDREYLK